MTSPPERIGDIPLSRFDDYFPGGRVYIDYGACRVAVTAPVAELKAALHRVYGAFAYLRRNDFSDFHVGIHSGSISSSRPLARGAACAAGCGQPRASASMASSLSSPIRAIARYPCSSGA